MRLGACWFLLLSPTQDATARRRQNHTRISPLWVVRPPSCPTLKLPYRAAMMGGPATPNRRGPCRAGVPAAPGRRTHAGPPICRMCDQSGSPAPNACNMGRAAALCHMAVMAFSARRRQTVPVRCAAMPEGGRTLLTFFMSVSLLRRPPPPRPRRHHSTTCTRPSCGRSL